MKKIKIIRILFLLVISLMFFKNANSHHNAELDTKELKRLSQIIKNYSFVKKKEGTYILTLNGKSTDEKNLPAVRDFICNNREMGQFLFFPDQKNLSHVVVFGLHFEEKQYKISLLTYNHKPAIKIINSNTNVVIPVKIHAYSITLYFPKKDGTNKMVTYSLCKNLDKDLVMDNILKKIVERGKSHKKKNDPDFRKKEQFLRKKRQAKCKIAISLFENHTGSISRELAQTYGWCKTNGF